MHGAASGHAQRGEDRTSAAPAPSPAAAGGLAARLNAGAAVQRLNACAGTLNRAAPEAVVQRVVTLDNPADPLSPLPYSGFLNPLDPRLTAGGYRQAQAWLDEDAPHHFADEAAFIDAANEAAAGQADADAQPALGKQKLVRGAIMFMNVSRAFEPKAAAVLDVFNRHPRIVRFIGKRPCAITLVLSEGNPASVSTGPGAIAVEIATWYFENYSVGEIVGMLNHEFGIHPVADEELGEGDRVKRDADDVQIDHVEGTARGSPRAEIYRDVVLQSALLLGVAEARKSIYAYLMDVATIVATGDHRDQAWKHPRESKQVYVQTRADLAATIDADFAGDAGALAHLHAALPAIDDFSIFSDFGKAGFKLLSGRRSKSSIAPGEGGSSSSSGL